MTTSTITSNYSGKAAGSIIAESFKSADTIEKGLITVVPNISDGKGYIRRVTGSNGLTDYSCSFTPGGTLGLDEKILEPKKLMINQEFCKEDFRGLFDGISMGYSAWNDADLPADEKEAIMARVMDELAQTVDSLIWVGNKANDGEFDGLIPQLEADAAVIDVTGVASTAANVVAELSKVYAAIPDKIFGKQDLVIAVSSNIYRNYIASQAALGSGTVFNNQNQPVYYFNGVALELVEGLPANTAVAYRKSNLFMGTALQADLNEVRLIDMSATTGDDVVRVKVVFAADTQFGFGGEVVLYNI